jgi:hypothetical protein
MNSLMARSPRIPGKAVAFKKAWRNAVEKYSPKKNTRLNEVSQRFAARVEEVKQSKGHASEAALEAANSFQSNR